MNLQQVKQRFGIIGNAPLLNRALEVAIQVAPTDISILVNGESGTGKEMIPQIIHQLSSRKHGEYIAVNCGAIPEGTIDSELFGHEKGSFTGAAGSRQGYFEVANGGTIFLDEVAELPMQTQVRLLRILETGEFIRVGASKPITTNVRVVAATNENMQLFRKFASDFADKYKMPSIKLTADGADLLSSYSWPGNIRQLRNMVEQLSVIETSREIDAIKLAAYLPKEGETTPLVVGGKQEESFSERELMYKFLFDMKKDLSELKKLVIEMVNQNGSIQLNTDQSAMVNRFYQEVNPTSTGALLLTNTPSEERTPYVAQVTEDIDEHIEVEESLSLEDRELGISERTLYRKIKEYNLSE